MTEKSDKGFSLLEVLLAAAFFGVILISIVTITSRISTLIQRMQARQLAGEENRICLDTIGRVFSNAKASTLIISAPDTVPVVPNSRAQIVSEDGSTFTITWSTSPATSVHLYRTGVGSSITTDTILARHVYVLAFTTDYRDPTLINVTYQISIPLNSAGTAESFYAIFVDKHAFHMLAN